MNANAEANNSNDDSKYIMVASGLAGLLLMALWLLISNTFLRAQTIEFTIQDRQTQSGLAQIVVVYPSGLSIDDNGEFAINARNLTSSPVTITNLIRLDPKWFRLDGDASNLVVFSDLQPGEVRTKNLTLYTTGLTAFDSPSMVTNTQITVSSTICCQVLSAISATNSTPLGIANVLINRWLFPLPEAGPYLFSTPGLRSMLTAIDFKVFSAFTVSLTTLITYLLSRRIARGTRNKINSNKGGTLTQLSPARVAIAPQVD